MDAQPPVPSPAPPPPPELRPGTVGDGVPGEWITRVASSRRRGYGGAALIGAVVVAAVLGAAIGLRGEKPSAAHYLFLSMTLFVTGAAGVVLRRNALVLFMSIELMLNSVNLAFVTFARMNGRADGQVIVLFVMIVAAAEVAIGLAIIVSIFQRRLSANVDDVSLLRW